MVFPVVRYGCESWAIKKAECQRIDDFELWCWRRLLRVPWTARRSNQSILKEISPGISLEGMIFRAETPVFWTPHMKSWLFGKDSDVGRDWGQEEKGMTEDKMAGWRHWIDGRESEWTPGVGDGQGGLACCDSWGCKESDMTERLNWTELKQWEQPKCTSADEQVTKCGTMEYYLVIKWSINTGYKMDGPWKCYTMWRIQTQKNTYCMIPSTSNVQGRQIRRDRK